MGPVVWWWRWWLGMDPNRDRELTEEPGLVDTQGGEADTRSTSLGTHDDELEQLRGRVRTLDDVRREADDLRGQVNDLTRTSAKADRLRAELDQSRAETAELRARLAQLESALPEAAEREARQPGSAEPESESAEPHPVQPEATEPDAPQPGSAPAQRSAALPDVSDAAQILGSSIALDDLTVVEGVGPKIAGLLADAGVDTWQALADTDVDRLREVLADAGPRYRMHDPTSWPRQAELLAGGHWQEFKDRKQA